MSSCETSYTLETIYNMEFSKKKKNHRAGCFKPSHRLSRTHSQSHWYVSFLATLVRDSLLDARNPFKVRQDNVKLRDFIHIGNKWNYQKKKIVVGLDPSNLHIAYLELTLSATGTHLLATLVHDSLAYYGRGIVVMLDGA